MISRRAFLQTAAAAAAAGAVAREPLREFPYSDVVLTGGPLKQQYDWVHAHFLTLDNDRLLKATASVPDCPRRATTWAAGMTLTASFPATPSGSTSRAFRGCMRRRATRPRWRR